MKTRNFILAAATGMTLAASALAFDSLGDASALAFDSFGDSMWNDLLARQQVPSGQSALAQQERSGGTTQAITGAHFDREAQLVSRSLQRGDLPVATDSVAATRDVGVAGSAGVVMGLDGQPKDTGSAWFDNYVDQVSRRLRLDEPAFD